MRPLVTATSTCSTTTEMSPASYQVLNSPLLRHDRPTTSLLKEGPGLYQLHFMQPPGLAFPDPQQEVLLGLDNCEINTPPRPSQGTAVPRWSEPSLRWHSAPHSCHHPLAQWSTHHCYQRELYLPGTPSHLGDDRFSVSPVMWVRLHLPSCPLPTVPFNTTQPLNKSHATHL